MSDETMRATWEAGSMSDPVDRSGCPSPEALLDALEGATPDEERDAVVEHLSRCLACRKDASIALALVDAARGMSGEGDALPGPDPRRTPRGGSGGGLGAWALAASVVLVLGGGGVLWWGVLPDRSPMRGDGGRFAAPEVTCPSAVEVEVRWELADGARDYRVQLFLEDGSSLAEAVLSEPPARFALALPEGVGVASARALVETRLADGSVTASRPAILPPECGVGG